MKIKVARGIQFFEDAFTVNRICKFPNGHIHQETHVYRIDYKNWSLDRCKRRVDRVTELLRLDLQNRLTQNYFRVHQEDTD